MTNDKPTINELLQRFAPEYRHATNSEWTLHEFSFSGRAHTVSGPVRFTDEGDEYPMEVVFDRYEEAKLFHQSRENALLASQVKPLVEALDAMDKAFCSRHGCFPLDRSTDEQKLWNDAMRLCRKALQDAKQCKEAVE